ncbi:hypothetical protein K2X92_02335 [Candidatus Gracilibacteria bacterium]|nr:hypothetical protein [Candidatus Gracilibacteria bacterium]
MTLRESPTLPVETPKPVIELSREALAKKLGIGVEELPDKKFFTIVNDQLDRLEHLNPVEKAKALKETLSTIRAQEVADRAKELGKDGIDAVGKLSPEVITAGLKKTTEQLKSSMGKGGTEVLGAVGEIVSADSIDGVTGGVGNLSKAITAVSSTITSAMNGLKDLFAAFMSMLGLDKLWNSIFGKSSSEGKKVDTSTPQKVTEGVVEKVKSQGDKIADAVLNEKERKDLIAKMSQGFGDKISAKYFNGQKLSEAQLKKINDIFTNSLDTESFQKIAQRYKKDGLSLNVGEITDAIWEVGGAFPTKVMWELSWSGIIPMWAITQHVIINPSKNLIRLTLEGLGFPASEISLSEWGMMLDKKAKDNDSHALDMARIQLYGVNSVLWRTMGSALAGASALGIMMTETTSKTNGISMAKMTAFKEYDVVASEFEKIEKTLAQGSGNTRGSGLFAQMMEGIRGIRSNSLLLDTVAKNTVNGVMDTSKIIAAIGSNSELANAQSKLAELKKFTDPKDIDNFRNTLKDMTFGGSSTSGWRKNMELELSKYTGGQNGSIATYLTKIDTIKASQINLLGNTGMLSEKWNRMKLAFQSLQLARSGDTVNLHLETADDISKFRSFLSVIPGGIKAISEIIPAAALMISFGSIAFDEKDVKDSTGESLMNLLTTALLPAYGTFGIIRSKTVDFGKMIKDGQVPEYSDIALTGVVGGVFMYEVTRVASGAIDIKNGNYMKGLSKLTYMHDIGRGFGQIVRGGRNVAALATKPLANPAITKTLAGLAKKVPRKGAFTIGAAALLAAGGAYASMSGSEDPEDIMKNLHKEGWLDIQNAPTTKMKEEFQTKSSSSRKEILDELLIMHLNTTKGLPKTHYDEKAGKYTLVSEGTTSFGNLIDSPFRTTIQSLGVDLDFPKVA